MRPPCGHPPRRVEYDLPDGTPDEPVTVVGACAACGTAVEHTLAPDRRPAVADVRAAARRVGDTLPTDDPDTGAARHAAARLRDRLIRGHDAPAVARTRRRRGTRHHVAVVPGRWVTDAPAAVVADPAAGCGGSGPGPLVRVAAGARDYAPAGGTPDPPE